MGCAHALGSRMIASGMRLIGSIVVHALVAAVLWLAVGHRSVPGVSKASVVIVSREPLKVALEDSLRASGYLASGTPKFHVDVEINNLQQPLMGLDMDVSADATYKVSGAGTVATYPIKSTGQATFSDSPIGFDRLRIANERSILENLKALLRRLQSM